MPICSAITGTNPVVTPPIPSSVIEHISPKPMVR
jgi:hypothetical protein